MRRVPAGLAGLALATGVATTVALSASAAPPDGSRGATVRQVSDDVPGRAEEKRRALRKAGLQEVLNGTAKVEQRGASKVVRVGETAAPAGAASKAAAEDQYVELGREKTDKIFVILAEFGNSGTRATRTRTPTPRSRARPGSTGRCTTRSRSRTARRTTAPIWQADYSRVALPAALLRHGRGRRVAQDATTSASRRVATASTARSPTGSRCPTTRRATAAATDTRAPATSAATRRR